MREQGLPIDADRGRGGGVRLDRTWGVGRLNLAYPEAIDLLISIEAAEQMNSPMFLAGLGSVRRQLVASFSPEKHYKVKRLKSRILIGAMASTYVQTTVNSTPKRVVQAVPHYLLLNYPVWYVIAFDHLRDTPRTFRCDRILTAEMTETHSRLLPKEQFQHSLDGNNLLI